MKTYVSTAHRVGESKNYAKFELVEPDFVLAVEFRGHKNIYYFDKDMIGDAEEITITVEVPE